MLTDSRGCIISLALGLSTLAVVFVWDWFAQRKKTVRVFMAIMAVIVVMLTILTCREGTRHILSNWEREPVATVMENTEHEETPSSGTPVRSMVDKKGSGRVKAWKTTFKALKNEPELWFHGCGPYNIPDVLVANGVINPKNTHNQLLELLLGYGVMPLIVFLAWLLWLAWKCVILGCNKAVDWALRVLPAGILAMVMCNMFEARLLFYRYFIGSMFFLLAGLVSARVPKKSDEHLSK
jgi:O-antigen ligase